MILTVWDSYRDFKQWTKEPNLMQKSLVIFTKMLKLQDYIN